MAAPTWDTSKAPRSFGQGLEDQGLSDTNPALRGTQATLGIHYGPNGAQADIDTANQREADAFGRKAVGIDYGNANRSLGYAANAAEQGLDLSGRNQAALSMLGAQSAGATPSAAAINAQLGSQNAFQVALQGQAAGRTGLANAAMGRQALMMGGQAQLDNQRAALGARAQEFSNANQAYAAAGADYNAQNLGLAHGLTALGGLQGQMVTAQGRENLAQASLNQQYAENQEQQKYNIDNVLQQGELSSLGRIYGNYQAQNAINNQSADRTLQYLGAGANAAGSITAAASTYRPAYGSGDSTNSATSNSDTRTKEGAWDVLPLYEPEGQQLHQSVDGHAFLASPPTEASRPSLASVAMARQEPMVMVAAPAQSAKAKQASRKMTDAEMMALADQYIAQTNAAKEAALAQGPALRYVSAGDPTSGYNTQLTKGAEQAYLSKFGDNSDRDYDLRGAFAAGLTDGAKAVKNDQGGYYFPDHLPDTFKKPNHETFSDESKYAPYAPERAGHWSGDRFVKPDQGVMADANRKMAGEPYRYKPEFTPPDEVPGQIHHGFMAQNLEQNPVTATAVEEGPDGMKRVHHARMIQAMASGLSDLQRQVDETRMAMGKK